jgi:uncharacterized membrane protein
MDNNVRFGRIFYLGVLLFCVFEMARLWNVTPEQMAAHFNVQGNPDRFVPKAEFFWYQIQTLGVVLLVTLPLQILFSILPPGMINMPNREYWFAPERRAETVGRLNLFGTLMSAVILLAIQAAFEISAYANLRTPIMFNARLMFTVMAAAVIIISAMLIQLMVSFRTPASNERV